MRVLIADDHALLRKDVVEYLDGINPEWECFQENSLEAAEPLLTHPGVDHLTLDLAMPGMMGVVSINRLAAGRFRSLSA